MKPIDLLSFVRHTKHLDAYRIETEPFLRLFWRKGRHTVLQEYPDLPKHLLDYVKLPSILRSGSVGTPNTILTFITARGMQFLLESELPKNEDCVFNPDRAVLTCPSRVWIVWPVCELARLSKADWQRLAELNAIKIERR